ncbi:MAG: NDP-sugar synthase [Chloroflexota bacterium]
MRALILAAGEGTRLRPLTLKRPKPMLPVGGRPVLGHHLELLRSHGVRDVAINTHFRPDAIVDYVGDGSSFDLAVTYSHEEQLLGSAGAAKKLEYFFENTFIVLYGDVLTDLDLGELVAYHRDRQAVATLALYRVPDPERCGIVVMDELGMVNNFVEKPEAALGLGNLANAGIYILEPTVLSLVPHNQTFDFGQDLFPLLLEQGLPVAAMTPAAYVCDIGSIDRYWRADDDVRRGRVRIA